eukprot:SAG31_NODE_6643_length_1941_cov_1.518458_1_plen_56_part_10
MRTVEGKYAARFVEHCIDGMYLCGLQPTELRKVLKRDMHMNDAAVADLEKHIRRLR